MVSLAKFIMNPFARVGIIISALTLLVVGLYGWTHLTLGMPDPALFKFTSYMQDYLLTMEKYFSDGDGVLVFTKAMNYTTVENQLGMLKMQHRWDYFNVEKRGGSELYSW